MFIVILKSQNKNLKQVIFFFLNPHANDVSSLFRCCIPLLQVRNQRKENVYDITAIGSSTPGATFALLLRGLQCLVQSELCGPTQIAPQGHPEHLPLENIVTLKLSSRTLVFSLTRKGLEGH